MGLHRSSWMDKDLDALADLARRFFEKECAPHEERWGKQQFVDRDVWRQACLVNLPCISTVVCGAVTEPTAVSLARPAGPPEPGGERRRRSILQRRGQ